MSDIDDPRRPRDPDGSEGASQAQTPVDPAYAAGAGYTGEATGATPADTTPTVGPDPSGGDAQPTDPTHGASVNLDKLSTPVSAGGSGPSGGTGSTHTSPSGPMTTSSDDKMLALVAHGLNIAGPFTGGVTNLGALILAYVKKDTAPDWLRSHYVFAIRTVWIALIVSVLLFVVAMISIPLAFVGIGFLTGGLAGLGALALSIWIIVRGVVGLIKANENQPYPTPESYLL